MAELLRRAELGKKESDEVQLYYNLRGKSRKYQDVIIVEDITLSPGKSTALVHMNPDSVIDLSYIRDKKNILRRKNRWSMRSRFAQLSIEPDVDMAYAIASQLKPEYLDDKGKIVEEFDLEVPLYNHGRRDVFIPGNTGIFRGFCPLPETQIVGEKLRDLSRSGEMTIEGQYGTEWGYIYKPGTPDIIGVRVRIQEDLFWIPPSSDTTPITVRPNGPGYRNDIRKLLEPAPQDMHPRLLIAETLPMKIPKTADAIIATNIYTEALVQGWTINDLGKKKEAQHINSHLIDAGSEWIDESGEKRGIILEIRGKGHPLASPKFVDFYFVEAA